MLPEHTSTSSSVPATGLLSAYSIMQPKVANGTTTLAATTKPTINASKATCKPKPKLKPRPKCRHPPNEIVQAENLRAAAAQKMSSSTALTTQQKIQLAAAKVVKKAAGKGKAGKKGSKEGLPDPGEKRTKGQVKNGDGVDREEEQQGALGKRKKPTTLKGLITQRGVSSDYDEARVSVSEVETGGEADSPRYGNAARRRKKVADGKSATVTTLLSDTQDMAGSHKLPRIAAATTAAAAAKTKTTVPTSPPPARVESPQYVRPSVAKPELLTKSVARPKPASTRPAQAESPPKASCDRRQPSNGYDSLMNHCYSPTSTTTLAKKPSAPESVLMRRTRRSKMHARQVRLVVEASTLLTGNSHSRRAATFRFLSLPKELRLQIYRLAVVETRTFIRPDSLTGREQPDLAMVCRDVRSEVLPIFYGENTFALDLGVDTVTGKHGVVRVTRLTRWASALGDAGWFAQIRKWVFDISLRNNGASDPESVPTKFAWDRYLLLSLNFVSTRQGLQTTWRRIAEMHKEAACVMSGCDGHGMCTTQSVPEWLSEAVGAVTGRAGWRGCAEWQVMVELGQLVEAKADGLRDFVCEPVARSIEMMGESGEA